MKRLFTGLIALFPIASFAASPLLSGEAKDLPKWREKLEKFQKPVFPNLKRYPKPFHSPNGYTYSVKDVCTACHTLASHKKDKKYAPFYNAHSTYLSCNTCHFVKSDLTYGWADIRDGNVVPLKKGDFYGLRYVEVEGHVTLSGANNPARITPFLAGKPVEIPLKGNEALLDDIEAVSKMHSALTDKPLKCDDCHKPEGKLNFEALGFSKQRVYDLEHNEILQGLKKYETLHFPNFIWKR